MLERWFGYVAVALLFYTLGFAFGHISGWNARSAALDGPKPKRRRNRLLVSVGRGLRMIE